MKRRRWALSVVIILALICSACAGAIGDGEIRAAPEPDAAPGADAVEPENATARAASGPESAVESVSATTIRTSPLTEGTLVYQIEADTLGGWMPHTSAAAISGHLVLRSVYDLLAYPDDTGELQPNLLSSFTPNADASEWTLVTRDGVTFHDGTPFDAAAVVANLELHRTSPTTGAFMIDVLDLTVTDSDTVVVTLAGPRPHFPARFTTVLGYMASPTWLAAVSAGEASNTEPVGTGPFVYAGYEPGQFFEATQNADYWREGHATVPAIRFEMRPSGRERVSNVVDGNIGLGHTDSADEILRSRDLLGTVGMAEAANNGETSYLMLNQADPTSPLTDLDVRRALAQGVDRDLWKAARSANFFDVANGPFPPGSIGHLEDSGFPAFAPEEAASAIAAYEDANGPIELVVSISDRPVNLISADLLAQMWGRIGVDVTLSVHPQSELIGLALTAQFDVLLWRSHGSWDPSLEGQWWSSQTAAPVGQQALNISRIRDDVIDQNLVAIAGSPDPAIRQAAAEALNRRFAEQVYNIWLSWPVWTVVHHPGVHLEGAELPSGDAAMPLGVGIGGAHLLSHVWLEDE
ncbi:MAG: ABC transporter substrate-binding protein [Acidimicrobiales bacterium]